MAPLTDPLGVYADHAQLDHDAEQHARQIVSDLTSVGVDRAQAISALRRVLRAMAKEVR